jgi:dihydrolipoamide dehydrogenase
MIECDVVVLGSGPGGYTAAFRAADLGLSVVLVEQHATLGGVCLNVGCIPSKALLHVADTLTHAREMKTAGVSFSEPVIDINAMRAHKNGVVQKLTGGLSMLAKQRKVHVVHGVGAFVDEHTLNVTGDTAEEIRFQHAIIAAGSRPIQLPNTPNSPRIIDSTGALALENIPRSMLVIGGGIIGLEMATVYQALGTEITVVELGNALIPGADKDIVTPLSRKLGKTLHAIYLNTRVRELNETDAGIQAVFDGENAPEPQVYDKVLVAIGRTPNGGLIDADKAGVEVDERGFIAVDEQMRTNVSHIFAIGDIVGQPMLAHKAVHEGKTAAEVIAGEKVSFDPLTIPSVAYTNPEVAWCGLTESEAKAQGVDYDKGVFPWAASGRSLSIGRDDGMTKLLFSKEDGRLIGAGIVGPNAGELIAEAVLAMEMGADAEDIGLTIHPHPTLSETLCFAAEMASGTITDLLPPRKR